MGCRVYLAGPEVFLPPDVRDAVFAEKRRICARHGIEGVAPIDGDPVPQGLSPGALGLHISRRNEDLMRSCELLIANMTPFRGPSADVGTAYELGFMRGLGKPTLGYSNTPAPFLERTAAAHGGARCGDGWRDSRGLQIEDFGLVDNLMLDGAVHGSGFQVVLREVPDAERYTDLVAFGRCVELAAEWVRRHRLRA